MLFKSSVYTQTSGSVGGLTYSHNRGGMYTRARRTPVDPNTPRQQGIKAAMGNLANRWVNTLTAVQRTAWDTYAFNVPLVGPTGDPRNVGGIGMYCRSNIPRIQTGLSIIDVAPIIWDVGNFTNPVTTYDDSAQTCSVAFTAADPWNLAGGAMLIYMGRAQNPTIQFYKGPFRYLGSVPGIGVSPVVLGPPLSYSAAVGQAVFTKIRVTYPDGRLTYPIIRRDIVVA
jgi:hypothetical protein